MGALIQGHLLGEVLPVLLLVREGVLTFGSEIVERRAVCATAGHGGVAAKVDLRDPYRKTCR